MYRLVHSNHCDDIAIIGGGIAGAYSAWRLRNTNQSISVYEYSDRIGGRLHTSHMTGIHGFNAELGGMRFHEPCKVSFVINVDFQFLNQKT